MIFERKIMRKIYGPTRTKDGYWRIKTNQEISYIIITIIFINCSWVVTRWQWSFYIV